MEEVHQGKKDVHTAVHAGVDHEGQHSMGGTPCRSRVRPGGGRSSGVELWWTDHAPCPAQGGVRWRQRSWDKGVKLSLEKGSGGGVVLIFVFVSPHPNLL